MRIIFLDIDGVLNSILYLNSDLGKDYVQGVKYPLIEWWASGISRTAVARLNRLVSQAGAAVVVSSTWRHGGDAQWLQRLLEMRGFEGQVVGKTPDYEGEPRRLEVAAWVHDHRPASFVVLDDDVDAEIPGRFVRTDPVFGLRDQDVEEGRRILKLPAYKDRSGAG